MSPGVVRMASRAEAFAPEELFAWPDGRLDKARVTQCALSRVCGHCKEPLGRPVAFVGDDLEVGRNAFHAPPMHAACAELVKQRLDPAWNVVLTSGFEFHRPDSDDPDRMPRFLPNSIL